MTVQTMDAIIIGGGVQGTSLAFHLSQRGIKSVVLERNTIASGATGRSGGLVRMHYNMEDEARLAWASFPYFENWGEVVGGNCGFTQTGFLHLAKPEDNETLRATVAMQQGVGIDTQIVTAEDVRRLEPILNCDDFELAAYEPRSGYADPTSTANAFMQAARQRGSNLVQGCQVMAIDVVGGNVAGVQTNKGKFSAPIVVNVAGAWAAEVGKMVNLDLPIAVVRLESIVLRRPPDLCDTHHTVIDKVSMLYLHPETGGLMVAGTSDSRREVQSPDVPIHSGSPELVDRAVDRVCHRIPGMLHGSLHSSYGGYDGYTPDGRAILSQAGPEGFYLACGFSGTGFKTAPAVGACMAELILDGQATTVDIAPFSFQRFAKNGYTDFTNLD